MDEIGLDYGALVADALRGVARRALDYVARRGLPGDHHFYITFATAAPGVRLSPALRQQFPEQMTIVLQNRFSDLKVDERGFGVTLAFGGKPERLLIPFAAILAFVDPSVNFGLPLGLKAPDAPAEDAKAVAATDGAAPPSAPEAAAPPPAEPGVAAVVRLDQFRKK